jgi:PAS domain S-box-containing protein
MDASETALWRLFFVSRTQERDPDFRSILANVLHTGLRQCGAIGLVGVLLYVGLSVLGLGYEVHWTYDAIRSSGLKHQIVASGLLIVAALSVIGLVLAQMECSLRAGRLFGLGAVLLSATVATFEGALRGTFGTGYMIPMYLVIVAVVPFRPLQVLGIGGMVAVIVYVLGPSGLVWEEAPVLTAEMARHLAFVGGSSVLITATSAVLYRRHRAFGLAQASLQKNRDLLRRVQTVAQVGGWKYDPEADEIEATEALYQILELPPDRTLDRDAGLDMYPPDAREELASAIDRCLQENESFTLEAPINTGEGNRRWVHIRGTARERHDDTARLLGTLQDITERHEMEEQLRKREHLLRSITDNVNDGIYRIVPGDGLVYANKAFAHMFGYESADEVLALDPADLYAHSEEPAPLLRAAEAESTDVREVEFRRTDGSTFTGLLDGTVVRDETGAVEYADGVVTDITDLKEREQDLQQERDRFETLFQNLPTPVVQGVLTDGGARVQTINRAFEEVFGHDAPSVRGESICALIGPEENPSAMADTIQRAFEEDTFYTEVKRQTPDGARTFQLHFAARHREEERTEGYAMFVDVTERKERELALRERELKTEALYTATERLLRADDEAMVAERIEDLVRETFDYPHTRVRLPADAPSAPTRMSPGTRTSLADLAPSADNIGEEILRACRAGETVVADDLRDANVPLNGGDLRAAAFLPIAGHGLLSIGREDAGDISKFDLRLLEILSTHASVVLDRIDQEQSLRRSERRFRGIFENAGIGIALLDDNGHVLESNPALQRMLALDEEALRGHSLEAMTHPEDQPSDERLFDNLVGEENGRNDVEQRFLREDGEVFWGGLTLSPHEGPGDTQIIGMIEDIDDRKRRKQQLKDAKEKAEEMNRLKSAFLANMSHEIRTPLTSILGFAEAIGDAASTAEAEEAPIDEFAQRISKSGHRLLETLDSVLDLSQLEAGSMTLSRTSVDLTEEVREAVDLLNQKAEEEGVFLHTECPDAPVSVYTDQGALRRILRNLLSNAVKYTDEGGQAWIRVRKDDEGAVLEVEDTGIGMDPDRVPKLFNAFEQESTGTDRSHEGSGLGLAIVDRLVHEMGGSLEVDTEKGVGTCFTVRLPLKIDEVTDSDPVPPE